MLIMQKFHDLCRAKTLGTLHVALVAIGAFEGGKFSSETIKKYFQRYTIVVELPCSTIEDTGREYAIHGTSGHELFVRHKLGLINLATLNGATERGRPKRSRAKASGLRTPSPSASPDAKRSKSLEKELAEAMEELPAPMVSISKP